MLPVAVQLVEALRGDGHNPIEALDSWMLAALEGRPPSSVHELATSRQMRMGPRGKGPELETDYVVRWVRFAVERKLIVATPADDPERPQWRLTERGRARRR